MAQIASAQFVRTCRYHHCACWQPERLVAIQSWRQPPWTTQAPKTWLATRGQPTALPGYYYCAWRAALPRGAQRGHGRNRRGNNFSRTQSIKIDHESAAAMACHVAIVAVADRRHAGQPGLQLVHAIAHSDTRSDSRRARGTHNIPRAYRSRWTCAAVPTPTARDRSMSMRKDTQAEECTPNPPEADMCQN